MDMQPYNGWPNVFTWLVYTHLSSYEETDAAARAVVAGASSPFAADEVLREWADDLFGMWCDTTQVRGIDLLWVDLLRSGLRQVDWRRLTAAFSS